jgi:LCP family protein required for cell wall assembly
VQGARVKKSTLTIRAIAGVGLGGVVLLGVLSSTSDVARALRRGDPVVGAVIGTDLADHAPHSDTLMVWIYRPSETRLDVLSIPRDTRLDLPGYRFRRINEVFAYHYGQGRDADVAAKKVCEAVGSLFVKARATLQPPYYVQVDFDGFREVIDRLGGVTVSVDEPMDYDDVAGNFHVHLTTGVQHLSGLEALGFVRYRGRSGDRGRILRQMEFIQALFKRLVSPEIVWRAPRAMAEVFNAVHTNLSPWEMVFLAVEARRLTSQQVNTVLLPGYPKGATWEMDVERTAFILERMGKGKMPGGAKAPPLSVDLPSGGNASGSAMVAEAPMGSPVSEETTSKPITVKVWNASGRVGLAIHVVRRLRAARFDVVEWGNYSARQNKSRVIDRSGQFESARKVAASLGVVSIYSDVDPGLRTDVDVILGEDFGSNERRQGASSWK